MVTRSIPLLIGFQRNRDSSPAERDQNDRARKFFSTLSSIHDKRRASLTQTAHS